MILAGVIWLDAFSLAEGQVVLKGAPVGFDGLWSQTQTVLHPTWLVFVALSIYLVYVQIATNIFGVGG